MKYQSSQGNDADGGNHGISWYMVEQEMMFGAIGVKHWHFHHLVIVRLFVVRQLFLLLFQRKITFRGGRGEAFLTCSRIFCHGLLCMNTNHWIAKEEVVIMLLVVTTVVVEVSHFVWLLQQLLLSHFW